MEAGVSPPTSSDIGVGAALAVRAVALVLLAPTDDADPVPALHVVDLVIENVAAVVRGIEEEDEAGPLLHLHNFPSGTDRLMVQELKTDPPKPTMTMRRCRAKIRYVL